MKLATIALILALCLVTISLSGCINDKPITYYSNETMTISISSNYTGNYSAWIPTLFFNNTSELSPVWKDLRLTSDPQRAHLYSEMRTTDLGTLQYLEAQMNITLVGHRNLTEGKCCSATEDFASNNWAPKFPQSPLGASIPSRALLDPPNNSTLAFLHLDIKYSGKSNYCSRNDHIHGDIPLNGTWTNVIGDNIGAVCR